MLFCYELNSNKFDLKTQFHCTIHGVPLLATFFAFFFCPPANGHPGWRSGNAGARCACLRTPLGSCAARVRSAAEGAAAPAADHGRVRDGWCYEHQCQMAPSRGRLRRARQPQLRRGASSTVTRFMKVSDFHFIIE